MRGTLIIGSGSVLTIDGGLLSSHIVPKGKIFCVRHNDDGSMEVWIEDNRPEQPDAKATRAMSKFAGLGERRF